MKEVVGNKNGVWGNACDTIVIFIGSYKYGYGKKAE